MTITNLREESEKKMVEVKGEVTRKEMTITFDREDLKNLYPVYWEICRSGGVYWTGKRNPFTNEERAALESLMTEICGDVIPHLNH